MGAGNYIAAQAIRTALCEETSTQTSEELSPAYINVTLAKLRAVVTEASRCGLIGEEQRARVCDLQPVHRSGNPGALHSIVWLGGAAAFWFATLIVVRTGHRPWIASQVDEGNEQ